VRFNSEDIAELVDSGVDHITITPEGLVQSRERAGEFLVIQATLTHYLQQVSLDLSRISAIKDAVFADAIGRATGKNITEKKVAVAKDEHYVIALKDFEEMDAHRDWVKGCIRIFEHAHLLYRGASRFE